MFVYWLEGHGFVCPGFVFPRFQKMRVCLCCAWWFHAYSNCVYVYLCICCSVWVYGVKGCYGLKIFIPAFILFIYFCDLFILPWYLNYEFHHLSMHTSIHKFICLYTQLSSHTSVHTSIHIFIRPSIHTSVYPYAHLCLSTSIYLTSER